MPKDKLINEIYRYLQLYFYARGIAPWDAEELAQEVFCRLLALRQAELFYSQPYIYRIARSVMIDRYRLDKKTQQEIAFNEFGDTSVHLVDRLEDQDSPEALAEMHSIGVSITNCYNQMPPQRKKIVDLYLYENQSCKAVAAQCGITCSAVEKQVHKGRQELWAEINNPSKIAVA